ncbi:MAG: HlyD family efflux transporter periplasmic adaptor subunit, partial [Flavobacteriales bacterium]|nr:HlyD family efflux transporter periplasmic adaptor subunit [Flavobacteriales bacterium]
NFVKSLLRALIGVAIMGTGIFIASRLIATKPSPPIGIPPKPVKSVSVMQLNSQANMAETPVQGRVLARKKIEVFSEVNGRLLSRSKEFRQGVKFAEGEVLLAIDGAEQEMQVRAQRSGFLQLITSSLADIKIDYPNSFEAWSNYATNFKVEQSLAAIPKAQSTQEEFFLSNRGILNQYYQIKSAEERLQKFTIRAPFSGEVSESMINAGALVRAGQKMGAFVNTGNFEIEAAVSEAAAKYIKVNDEVKFTTSNGTLLSGVVLRKSQSIDPQTQTLKVFVEVNGENLRDGAYLSGVIMSESPAESIEISADLLTPNDGVYVVENSKLKLLRPNIIHRSADQVLISTEGIPGDTKFIAEPVANAYEGMDVNIVGE